MTKGDTLIRVSRELKKFIVPKLVCFDIEKWQNSKNQIIEDIKKIDSSSLIIRSSALSEDSIYESEAGLYDSIMNVSKNSTEIESSIELVIQSFAAKNNSNKKNKIIAQRQIKNVFSSGVIFTRELNSGAPYYVINYDDKSGNTNSVTSGIGENSNRTLYIHRDYSSKNLKSERFKLLMSAVKELEKVMNYQYLDIEFALDKNLIPYLFQVRKLTTSSRWKANLNDEINNYLNTIKKSIRPYFRPKKNIYGDFSILAQMPDWNPVELLGRSPKALDFSLYKSLITASTWRKARDKMGYFHPLNESLMIELAGQPFIDVRLSFNSYLPNDLSPEISNKLVNSWLNLLKKKPHLHDKVEFDVALTCYCFDINKKLNNYEGLDLSKDEKETVINSYRNLTTKLIKSKSKSSIKQAILSINRLQNIYKTNSSNKNLSLKDISKIINDTIKFGTIPFAILARHGFIAKTLLESIDNDNSFNHESINTFYNSIETVASVFHQDSIKLSNGSLKQEDFLSKYGHLRPGTYDITSLRYDQMDIDLFSSKKHYESIKVKDKNFLINNCYNKFDLILKKHSFNGITPEILIEYIEEAIKGREYAKFVFTKHLSTILEIIADYGKQNGFSREEISNIKIDELIMIENKGKDALNFLEKTIKKRKIKNKISNSIRLPQVLFEESGVEVIPFQISQPNFITKKIVEAKIFHLEIISEIKNLDNKVILIENADPGFDFIFNFSIKGLITKFGGCNSHMAIRCAEFDIPAAIGCGEQIFQDLVESATKVKINCLTNQIFKIY